MRELWDFEAPHFCCGLVVIDGVCTEAAPIVKWAKGKSIDYLQEYAYCRGWRLSRIKRFTSDV